MIAPVISPATWLRRAMAKKITTSRGRSKIEKNENRSGKNACRKIASSGTRIATGKLNR